MWIYVVTLLYINNVPIGLIGSDYTIIDTTRISEARYCDYRHAQYVYNESVIGNDCVSERGTYKTVLDSLWVVRKD